MHSNTNLGNCPRGSAKCVLFFPSPTRPFGYLSCTNFDHIWNKMWIDFPEHTPMKNLGISLEVLQAPPQKKTAPGSSILGAVLVFSVQLKQHNFGREKSFRGLVDIPCAFCTRVWMGDVWFGCYDPPNKGHSIINTTAYSLISRSRKNTV